MVTQRDTQRRAQPQGQKEQELRMRPASRQLIGVPDSRPQPPVEFIPREFLPALRAATRAEPQAVAPQAVAPQAAPQAATPQAAAPNTQLTGNPNVPRGYRNNNPLNIIDGSFVRGQPGYKGTDGRFGQFASMDDGIKAADNLLQSYGERGLNTPQSIIARWAPAGDGDNNPSAYAATVARNLGVEPGAAIDMANPAVRRQLIDAMATVENGRPMAPPIAPPKLADGGLIGLARKYADGGSVSRAAQVYDPAVIAAIAASIIEPQGYADGGTATGVSSDDAAPAQEQERVQDQRPRTFADLVRRYAVGDAMQMAAPLDDQSLGAGVSQSIGSYLRPIVQGNFEVPGTVKKYAIDVATGPKPFTRLGSDISTLGSAVWEGVKNDPVGTALDFVPVVSNVRSAMDMHELRNRAVEAEQAGDEDRASMYRQLSAVGAAGAIPLVGYGAIAARRAANAARDAAARRAGAGAGTALVVRGGVDDIDIGSGVGLIAREDAAAAAGARGTQAIAREGAEGVTAGVDAGVDAVAREGVGLEPSGAVARRAKAAARESAQAVAVVPRELSPLGFYSHGAETAANLAQAKGTPQQFRGMLEKYGVKPVELEGFDEAFANRPSVTREELAQHFSERRPQIEETVLGRADQGLTEAWRNVQSGIANMEDKWSVTNYERIADGTYNPNLYPPEALGDVKFLSDAFKSVRDLEAKGKSAHATPTKFQQYTLPGGENYREVLLKLSDPSNTRLQIDAISKRMDEILDRPGNQLTPELRDEWEGLNAKRKSLMYDTSGNVRKEVHPFQSTHWEDPNVLAHLRMIDRTGPNGEKILHLEELQSDWGQKGRTEGFADPKAAAQWEINKAAALKESREAQRQHADLVNRIRLTGEPLEPFNRGVESPRAFKRREVEHFNKRVDALLSADPDYRASRQRLDAAKDALNALGPNPATSGIPSAPYVTNTAAWTDLALKRALKEAAEGGYDKIVWTPGAEQAKRYSLIDKPREGMMNYYDKMVPNQLSKLVKRLDPDAKIEKGRMPVEGRNKGSEDIARELGMTIDQINALPDAEKRALIGSVRNTISAPSLTITPKMREAIMKGQTDFAEGGHVQGYADGGSAGGSADNSLAALYEKYHAEPTTRISYAQGGSVDSAPVYDPAVIAAIAASITEDNYA